jgi:hypothetical protein
MRDWLPAIGQLIKIHQQIRQLDAKKLWNHELPRVPATPERVREVENAIGPLDASYREFLLFADGWERFYQWVDLFGTSDLMGEAFQRASDRVHELERELVSEGVSLANTLPIAMTGPEGVNDAPDLFLIVNAPDGSAGRVLWLSSEVVDTFKDFEEFFASMTEYNRLEVADLSAHLRQS